MQDVDLNLLPALDVLLEEASVTRAAQRLGLSCSAMSRTLTRLRISLGDALLVRAGRRLVLTPHAAAVRERVHMLADATRAVLQPPPGAIDPAELDLTFTIRAAGSFIDMLCVPLVESITRSAPNVRVRFMARSDTDATLLRQGLVDLEIGRIAIAAPEIRSQALFSDSYVGVARAGHSLLSGRMTLRRFAACGQVAASQFAGLPGTQPESQALQLATRITVPGYPEAMRIAGISDLIAIVPRSTLGNFFVKDRALALGIRAFELPVRLPRFSIMASWHPRVEAEPAHRWLRDAVISVCKSAYP